MEVFLKEAKKLVITLLIMDILIILTTILLKLFDVTIIFGIIYGFVFCLLSLMLLGTIVEKALTMTPRRAKRHMQINYAVRLVLMVIILTIPFCTSFINGWVVAISMLAPKLTYFSIGFADLIPKRKEKDNIEH